MSQYSRLLTTAAAKFTFATSRQLGGHASAPQLGSPSLVTETHELSGQVGGVTRREFRIFGQYRTASFFDNEGFMCRNIRPLFNFEPPASDEEIRASALQFVRKVSGFAKPSHANAEAFDRAVDEVTEAARRLIFSLHSAAPPRDRDTEGQKARERSRLRYG